MTRNPVQPSATAQEVARARDLDARIGRIESELRTITRSLAIIAEKLSAVDIHPPRPRSDDRPIPVRLLCFRCGRPGHNRKDCAA